jgi:hypothetical protein
MPKILYTKGTIDENTRKRDGKKVSLKGLLTWK